MPIKRPPRPAPAIRTSGFGSGGIVGSICVVVREGGGGMKKGRLVKDEVGVRGGVNGKEMKVERGEESEVREKRKEKNRKGTGRWVHYAIMFLTRNDNLAHRESRGRERKSNAKMELSPTAGKEKQHRTTG
jgi:hypothetical protein